MFVRYAGALPRCRVSRRVAESHGQWRAGGGSGIVIRWLADLVGVPHDAGALLVSGAAQATVTRRSTWRMWPREIPGFATIWGMRSHGAGTPLRAVPGRVVR